MRESTQTTNEVNVRYYSYIWLIALLAMCGCGDVDGARRGVEGSVSYENEPIEYGEIRFLPEPNGPMTVAVISEGRYQVSQNQGVRLGQSRVQIKALSKMPEDVLDKTSSRSDRLNVMKIPEKYDSASELKVEIPSGSGIYELDFDLEK